ncbi:MAG: flavodoxin [Tissierellia bacterium]|nr:flavodoxin [Tissierellia bacterium]
MKVLIVYKSYHHLNTEKVAKAMASTVDAQLCKAEELSQHNIEDYDIVGFGSGIYAWTFHRELVKAIQSLNGGGTKRAFSFCTCGNVTLKYEKMMEQLLTKQGFNVMGHFCCLGFDTFGPYKLIGGLNKGKPNEKDLEKAKEFIKSLIRRI